MASHVTKESVLLAGGELRLVLREREPEGAVRALSGRGKEAAPSPSATDPERSKCVLELVELGRMGR